MSSTNLPVSSTASESIAAESAPFEGETSASESAPVHKHSTQTAPQPSMQTTQVTPLPMAFSGASTSAAPNRPQPVASPTVSESFSEPVTPAASKRRKRKVCTDVPIDDDISVLNKELSEWTKPIVKTEKQLFADSLVPALGRLSNYNFAIAKKRINNVLFELEFGNQQESQPQQPISRCSSAQSNMSYLSMLTNKSWPSDYDQDYNGLE